MQIITTKQYKLILNKYFDDYISSLDQLIDQMSSYVKSAAIGSFWDVNASRLLTEFDHIENQYKQKWLEISKQVNQINSTDKRVVIFETKGQYQQQIENRLNQIKDRAQQMLDEEHKYSITDQLNRDLLKGALEHITSYTLNSLLVYWILNS
jgi:DNA anti-recombination protein RmuC